MSNKTDRKFYCKKCGIIWIETNPKIIKVWCPKDHIIMLKVKNEKEVLKCQK